jgi:hypothetical protein
MKKSLYIFTLILIGTLTLMSFSDKSLEKTHSTDTIYYCVYSINHETEKLFISNIFSSNEYPDEVSASKYMENELDYKLESYRNTHLYSHEDKNFVYDDRLEGIKWAKDSDYKVYKFDVKCKNGKLYPKY